MGYQFENYKEDAIDRPRDKAWTNWWKARQIGDKAQGYIRDVFYRPEERDEKGQGFDAQRGITLEQADGTFVNVGIKRYEFILAKTNGLRLGDPLTIIFEAELPNRNKAYSATKQYGFYGKNLEENKGNKTVAELELIDIGLAAKKGEESAQADKEFAAIGTPTQSVPTPPATA